MGWAIYNSKAIVHMDLKSDNIFSNKRGYIIDLGKAYSIDEVRKKYKQVLMLNTRGAFGSNNHSKESDIFSIDRVVYKMIKHMFLHFLR